jgi:glycosyltransferase involved in cell wall biosynthesis
MRRVMADDRLREDMRERGLARVREFSWERSIRRVREIYDEVLAE